MTRLDWPAIAKDLARQVHELSELGLIQHILDDAHADFLALSGPDDFWIQVLSEYERLTPLANRPEARAIRQMLLVRADGLGPGSSAR